MDFRLTSFDSPLFATLHHLMDVPDEADKSFNAPPAPTSATPGPWRPPPGRRQGVPQLLCLRRRHAGPQVRGHQEAVSAVCRDGVLTVTVEKLPPPEPKKPKTVQVKIA
ncbi:hypothetical protein NL676_033797 [Syzygium grande]|nr:hypothetical protein NL676_033797 [Syzygium grande]